MKKKRQDGASLGVHSNKLHFRRTPDSEQQSLFADLSFLPSSPERRRGKPKRDWAADTQSLLIRHFGYGEAIGDSVRGFGISVAVAEARIAEAKHVSRLPIGRDFRKKGDPPDKIYLCDLTHNSSKEMARKISGRLENMDPREKPFFRDTIRFYVENVQESHKIMLGLRDWKRCELGETCNRIAGLRNIALLVERLNIPDLSVQYFGYLCNNEEPDLSGRLQQLGAPCGTRVEYIKPPNPKSKSNHLQIGIGIGSYVTRKDERRFDASIAFRRVMALAAIRRIWLTPEEEVLGGV
jgi:hypothetical protein